MNISSYIHNGRKHIIISIAGKLFFFKVLTLATIKSKWRNIWLKSVIDYDCDGTTLTVTDRLTDGKIFYAHSWNFSRVGGSIGCRIERFGRPDKENDEE